ncbi:MAG: Crp/Fnr family transcriptional regulator [Bacteroidota bacterium]
MESIKLFIQKYVSLSEKDWLKIGPCFSKKTLSTESTLLQEGKICRHLYFLESGLLRYSFLNNGEEVTKFFTEPPYMFTSQQSLNFQTPARESIIAVEESTVWQMGRDDAFRLLELKPWSEFIRLLVQEVQYLTEEIMAEQKVETAENRYRKMLLENPAIIQKIPLKHLASFLGIAPQSLSRIRKNIFSQSLV